MRIHLDPGQSPAAWLHCIFDAVDPKAHGDLGQHLIEAKLAVTRQSEGYANPCPNDMLVAAHVPNGARRGDSVFVFTTGCRNDAALSVRRCHRMLRRRLHPVLVSPERALVRVRHYAEFLRIERSISLLSMEDFFSANVFLLAGKLHEPPIDTASRIVNELNTRLAGAGMGASLMIELV